MSSTRIWIVKLTSSVRLSFPVMNDIH